MSTPVHTVKFHLTGVLFHGVGAYMVVSHPYVAGGANLKIEALYRSLLRVKQQRNSVGKELPRTLLLQADNAASELKNKTFFAFCAAMVENGVFEQVVLSFLLKGHTHEVFSLISRSFKKQDILSRSNFDDAVITGVQQSKKCAARCEVIHLHGGHNYAYKRTGSRPLYEHLTTAATEFPPHRGHVERNFSGYTAPHSFVFSCESKGCRRVCTTRYRSFSMAEKWYPRSRKHSKGLQYEVKNPEITAKKMYKQQHLKQLVVGRRHLHFGDSPIEDSDSSDNQRMESDAQIEGITFTSSVNEASQRARPLANIGNKTSTGDIAGVTHATLARAAADGGVAVDAAASAKTDAGADAVTVARAVACAAAGDCGARDASELAAGAGYDPADRLDMNAHGETKQCIDRALRPRKPRRH